MAFLKAITNFFKLFLDKVSLWHWLRLKRSAAGYILILVGCFVPVVLYMAQYTEDQFKKRMKSIESLSDPNDATYYKECAREIALAVAKEWNPAKTLKEQEAKLYEIAKNIYNAHPCLQKGGVRSAIPGLIATTVDGDKIELPPDKKQFSKSYVKISVVEDATNLGKIKVQTDYQVAYAVPALCNVDVVLAVPTNSGSYPEMGRACSEFAKSFYYTRGVYVGIVPYSGKLSVPNFGWTVACDGFPTSTTSETVALSSLYATKKGANENLTSYSYASAAPCPIMYRKDGSFLSTDAPSGNKRFQQMNLTPCYASPQSAKCEKGDCRTFAANPAIMELTADMEALSGKCNTFSAIRDTYNSSNFLFLPLEWANNLFKGGWNKNPKQSAVAGPETSATAILGSQDKMAPDRKKAVILIVNKPNNFEPAEMTYLGFKNDLSQVLVKSDVIDFSANYSTGQYADGTKRNGTIEGAKKLLKFTGTADGSGDCTLTMSQKHLLKLVVEPKAGNAKGSITFTNIKNMSSAPTTYYQNNNKCDIYERTVVVLKPEQINDNKRVEFKTENMKLISAEMTDKVPTAETQVDYQISGEKVGTGTATITTNTKRPLTLKVVPKRTYAKIWNTEKKDFETNQTFRFTNQTSNLTYKLDNATIISASLSQYKKFFDSLKQGKNTTWSDTLPFAKGKLTIKDIGRYYESYGNGRNYFGSCSIKVQVGGKEVLSMAVFDKYKKENYDPKVTVTNHSPVITNTSINNTDYHKGDSFAHGDYDFSCNFDLSSSTDRSIKIIGGNDGDTSYSNCGHKSLEIEGACTATGSETMTFTADAEGVLDVKSGGDVTIKVKPDTLSPSITRTKPNSDGTEKQDFSNDETITIDPSEYDYVKNNGKYTITLNLTDIEDLKELDMPNKIRLFSMADSTAPAISDGNKALSNYNGTTKDLDGLTRDTANALKKAGSEIYLVGYKYHIPDDMKVYASGSKYIYEASDEVTLKQKLQAIVQDIKNNLAKYKHARRVKSS